MDSNAVDPLSFDVSGKHVLITGGTGGIGMAFAQAFADRGSHVVVSDIKPPAEPLRHERMRFEMLDVRDEAAVNALAAKMEKLDVLIHCAGTLVPFKEHQPGVFEKIVDIHLFGNVRLAAAFRPHLKERRGCIINIGSMYSYFGNGRVPAYAAAKTAVMSLTKSLAIAYAEDGIRVNAIAPGWIDTEISKGGQNDEAFNATVMARLPSKRWSPPVELAGTALFLASAASSLVNGVMIPVDGGYVAS
ncbi:SDR family NAD(P)-dependent oxidoreductase [Variovorax sp. VNK109]|uniref:SDR family NAD(P)-dependent oxidoreductase n=1 Tax=Variovorax sp. VNK109 TaxID=3400919 RepID=UPI003C0B42C6